MSVLKILAVGDIMLGDQALRLGSGVGSVVRRKGPDFILERIRPALAGADFVFGNLETVLSDECFSAQNFSSRVLRGAPESVLALPRAGFNILSIANNHIHEHGPEAFQDTLRRISASGIAAVGRENAGGGCLPLVLNCRGKRVGFLAYSLVGREDVGEGRRFLSEASKEGIIAEVRSLRKQTDLVCVSLHWGYEYMEYPSPEQIIFAHQVVESGARIILGHHPHCLQGIEMHRGGLICYSLGNFIFDFRQKRLRSSCIARFDLKADGSVGFAPLPVLINRRFQPCPVGGQRREKMKHHLEALSQQIPRFARIEAEEYRSRACAAQRRLKLSNRLHFVANLWRYPPQFLIPALKALPEAISRT